MNSYKLEVQESKGNDGEVTEDFFGVNVVTIYDEEIANDGNSIVETLNKTGASHLRFPGGSATEHYFDMADPEAAVSNYEKSQTLLPLSDFLDAAANVSADVALVIPTKRAFTETAASSIASGSFGARQELSDEYILEVKSFLRYSLDAAKSRGVEVTAVEIGNEFWGSGEMTATEYGHLVGQLLPVLDEFFDNYGLPDTKLLIQTTHAVSQVYSPRSDVDVFVGYIDGVETVLSIEEAVNLGFIESAQSEGAYTVQAQGSAVEQVRALASTINSYDGSPQLVDGILDHFYPTKGFSGIDNEYEFFFNQFNALADQLDLTESARKNSDGTYALEFHVTEWNTRSQEWALENRGLHQSAMLVEILYEFATHGVDSANAWPLTFDQSQSVTLVNNDQSDLTIAGETFRLMSEFIPGTSPIFDWSLDGDLDIHGFSSVEELVLVVSERSGSGDRSIILDLSDYVGAQQFNGRIVKLWDGTGEGNESRAEPKITEYEVKVSGAELEIDLQPWEIAFVEIVTGDVSIPEPIIYGTEGSDLVSGDATNDTIIAIEGDDTIIGGGGQDLLRAGDGDDWAHGRSGKDSIEGNSGNDTLFGGARSDTLHGGGGADELYGNRGSDTLYGGRGGDALYGSLGKDVMRGNWGNDTLYGGRGGDTLLGGLGDDSLSGGSHKDRLFGGLGSNTLAGGDGADTFVFRDIASKDRITDFRIGTDRIHIQDGADSLNDLSIAALGNDAVISFGSTVIVVDGVTVDELIDTDNFLF